MTENHVCPVCRKKSTKFSGFMECNFQRGSNQEFKHIFEISVNGFYLKYKGYVVGYSRVYDVYYFSSTNNWFFINQPVTNIPDFKPIDSLITLNKYINLKAFI